MNFLEYSVNTMRNVFRPDSLRSSTKVNFLLGEGLTIYKAFAINVASLVTPELYTSNF